MAGKMINPPALGAEGETKFIRVKEADTELFQETDDSSEVFKVANDGSGILLTAFCLEQPLFIEMVKIDIQKMPSGGPDCCTCKVEGNASLLPQNLTDAECVSQLSCGKRGSWAMGYGVNMGVIAVPGSYRLCPTEPCDLSNVSVCARLISAEGMKNIPSELIFGNTK